MGGGAVALFIFLFFFKWFGASVSGSLPVGGVSTSSSATGWDTFTSSRWLWLLTIVIALGAVVLVAGQRKLELPVQPSVIVAGLGALSSLFIFYRIVHHPHASVAYGGFHASYGIKIGIWLGLISALAIAYGGYLQMQEEGTSLSDVREQASDALGSVTAPVHEGSSSAGAAGSGGTGAAATTPPTPPAAPPAAPPPIPPPVAAPDAGAAGEGGTTPA